MCRAIEKNLESVGMGIEKISEIDILVFEDDEIRQNHFYEKMNRANRRHNTANKKHRLGKSYRFCKEQIDAYVKQDGKLKWLDDMDNDEYLQIDWSKVKAVNAENCEYGFWEHGIKKAYSRNKQLNNLTIDVSDKDIDVPCIGEDVNDVVKMFSDLDKSDKEEELFKMGYRVKYSGGKAVDVYFEGFFFDSPKMYQDEKLNEKLVSCRRAIKTYKDLVNLKTQRTVLMEAVHEANWKIGMLAAMLDEYQKDINA